MKTKILFAAAALTVLTACSSDDSPIENAEQRMPVTLAYTTIDAAETRAAQNLNQGTLASGESVKVRISNTGTGSWTDYTFTTAAEGAMTAPTPAPYYPAGSQNIDIVAYYPTTAGTSFSVASDQTADANYKASDLMFASVTNQAKQAAAVELAFTHKMAKLNVNITPGEGVTSITGVSILNVRPTVSFNQATGAVGSATGSATSIAVSNGGAAVIPAQTIPGNLLSIVTDKGTATYSVPSGKEFAAGQQYTLNITVNLRAVGTTNEITGWTSQGTVNVYPTQAVRSLKYLPLYFVDEYNIITVNSSDLTTGFTWGISSLKDGYFWRWKDTSAYGDYIAESYFGPVGQSGFDIDTQWDTYYTRSSATQLLGRHLPIRSEWLSIVPGLTNIFAYAPTVNTGVLKNNFDLNPKWGTDATTKAGVPETSYFYATNVTDKSRVLWAVRFIGTPYCSLWCWKQGGGWTKTDYGYMTITAKLLDPNVYTQSYVESNMATIVSSGFGSTTVGDYTGDDHENTVCRRTFYACGSTTGTDATATNSTDVGKGGGYWSATRLSGNTGQGYAMVIGSKEMYVQGRLSLGKGYPIRMFRDN